MYYLCLTIEVLISKVIDNIINKIIHMIDYYFTKTSYYIFSHNNKFNNANVIQICPLNIQLFCLILRYCMRNDLQMILIKVLAIKVLIINNFSMLIFSSLKCLLLTILPYLCFSIGASNINNIPILMLHH